jgi:hypothetical protein
MLVPQLWWWLQIGIQTLNHSKLTIPPIEEH